MKIACIQFAPRVGDVNGTISRVDELLDAASSADLDVIVLPELGFLGNNFPSPASISEHLERNDGKGVTFLWAKYKALRHECAVIAGYGEDHSSTDEPSERRYYNAALVVNRDGESVGHVRKAHLLGGEKRWATDDHHRHFFNRHLEGLGHVSVGLGLDICPIIPRTHTQGLNLARHVQIMQPTLFVVPMAWPASSDAPANEPDRQTLSLWVALFEPLIYSRQGGETFIVFCNRTGSEGSIEYAGTSTVVGVEDQTIKLYGRLNRGEEGLLIVNTYGPPIDEWNYERNRNESIRLLGNALRSVAGDDADFNPQYSSLFNMEPETPERSSLGETIFIGRRLSSPELVTPIDDTSPVSSN